LRIDGRAVGVVRLLRGEFIEMLWTGGDFTRPSVVPESQGCKALLFVIRHLKLVQAAARELERSFYRCLDRLFVVVTAAAIAATAIPIVITTTAIPASTIPVAVAAAVIPCVVGAAAIPAYAAYDAAAASIVL
jgi:hypothetical protein